MVLLVLRVLLFTTLATSIWSNACALKPYSVKIFHRLR
ncbi:hypothetical protein CPter291_3920 [Collimonas pratensis]|uniref:Lipoprotein n=1 Tax=Collimonas pratensis TaxID=279113 RepID=A0ABM5ZBD1_9BURK|nr:hypothetical protein CPter291_3920 [Collimonas pratensis]